MIRSELRQIVRSLILDMYGDKQVQDREQSYKSHSIILNKFPSLKEVIVTLFTEQYDLFIDEIQWVAPKPTTFKIVLPNGQFFYIIYGRSWIAQIEGKKYYLSNIKERENASQALSRILKLGQEFNSTPKDTETDQKLNDESETEAE